MKIQRWKAVAGLSAFAVLMAVSAVAVAAGGPGSAPSGPPTVLAVPFASGLIEPVDIAFTPLSGDTRMFVAERSGIIRIVQPSGTVLPTPFLDISATVDSVDQDEMGLLGLAFDPQYATNGNFFVYYTGKGSPGGSVLHLSRFHVSANPNIAELAETSVLTINHPSRYRHSGGQLAFGPEGYLYLAPGDGGVTNDAPNNAQRLDSLLGKVLRLNVSGVPTYTIPASNPFTQTVGARGEIWARGLRNPFRFSFDRTTNDLYIGDVGEDQWEELDFQPHTSHGGENYGWHCYEGDHPFTLTSCTIGDAIFPIVEYSHTDDIVPNGNNCIIGGFVYRGSASPALDGYYLYADNGSGNFWEMDTSNHAVTPLGHLLNFPSTFGQDSSGELYAASFNDGTIVRLQGPVLYRLHLPLVTRT